MMALITSRAGSVLASLLCVALLFCLSGCGSSSSLLPVEGKVTVDGQALTRGSIAFHPDAKKQNTLKKALAGDIKDGTYTIYTDGKPGAPPGWYNVTVAAATEADTSKVDTIKSLVHPTYTDPSKTPLSVEVSSSPKAGAYEFNVGANK